MSNAVIEPEAFGDAVESILNSYKKEVIEAAKEATKASADDCRDAIKRNIGTANIRGTGEYRASWQAEVEEETDTGIACRVFAKAPHYRLTHLLEHGHRKWLWGKETGDTVPAHAHIGPATRDMKKEFGNKLKVRLGK